MKPMYFSILFVCILFSVNALYAQVTITENPIVDNAACNEQVVGVALSAEYTEFAISVRNHLISYNPFGSSYIKFTNKTKMWYTDPETKSTVTVPVISMSLGNEKKLVRLGKKYGIEDFTNGLFVCLKFAPLPIGVDRISIQDDADDDDFSWKGIHIRPRESGSSVFFTITKDSISNMISNTNSPFAGIYEEVDGNGNGYQLSYIIDKDKPFLLFMDSEKEIQGWKLGQVKAELNFTAAGNILKGTWYMADKSKQPALVQFDDATMKITFTALNQNNNSLYIKMGNAQINVPSSVSSSWTGTGFALKDGYIVTNHHVSSDAKSIQIYGVNGDFTKSYTATSIGVDKVNDLAILKITDENFTGFGTTPYSIITSLADVGESIYVLGYPLTGTMGEEVKLTNGIISSKTGYDGDVALYQMSAPIQPGNSGGPMFNPDGDVIGIICAHHKNTENVGYAIKTSYLKNLVESVADLSILPTNNSISKLELKDQVKQIHNYVYLIKCSK